MSCLGILSGEGGDLWQVNLAGYSGGWIWQILMARHFDGSFWLIYLVGHFGTFTWRVFTSNEKHAVEQRKKSKRNVQSVNL
jgi:hypothetical protein